MKKFRITLGDKVHHVTVEVLGADPAVAAVPVASPMELPVPASLAAKVSAAGSGRSGEVRSPLAGKLVSLDVKVGQSVAEGSQVATIEAMKMNTYVFSPKSGPVAALIATPGEAVDENDVLLIID